MGYIIESCGEVLEGIFDYGDMMHEVKMLAWQYICDFMRHELPKKLTADDIRRFDIKVYEVNREQITLPFQAFVDEYYDDMREQKRLDEEREYKRFLELYEKYKDRIPE